MVLNRRYSIKNVSIKEVSNSNFSGHEVTLYATNKSECSQVVLFGQSLTENEFEMKMRAKFDCINATGARLTSKMVKLVQSLCLLLLKSAKKTTRVRQF